MNTALLASSSKLGNRASFLKAFLLVFSLCATMSSAQVASYQKEQLPSPGYTHLDVATKVNLITDYGITPATVTPVNTAIGFPFTFNGNAYTDIYVSDNGYITFGSAPNSTPLPLSANGNAFAGAAAPFGFDWWFYAAQWDGPHRMNTVAKHLDTSGGAGNSILKVEWRNVARANTSDGLVWSFQVWLYEGTNVIEYHYDVQTTIPSSHINGQVGLRGATTADFNNWSWSNVSVNNSLTWPEAPATMNPGTVNTNYVGISDGDSGYIRVTADSNRLFRWIPVDCSAPINLTASGVAASTATVTWTAPSPTPVGYAYYLSTSATAPTGATTPTGTTVGPSVSLTGLNSNATYYIWVRSDCGALSGWSAVESFTTLCAAANIPYLQYFDTGFTVPALPPCTSNLNIGTGNDWVTTNLDEEGFMDTPHLVYEASGSQAANTWFFTQGVNLVAGSTYRLSYQYGGSTNLTTLINKLEVSYGLAPENASMNQLANHPNIKESPVTNVVNFTAQTTGAYYFGFRAYSAANMARMFLDNIEITPSICLQPTTPIVSAVSYNSASATWTVPMAPPNGFAYYLSTSPTPPVNGTIPTGYSPANVLNLTGLTGSTTYYLWVQGNCGAPDMSEWSAPATFTTTATPPYCIPSSVLADSPINNVTTTNAITNINNSSGYVAPGYSDYTALTVTESQGGTFNWSISYATAGGVGIAIYIDWNQNGTFEIAERMYTSNGYISNSPVTGTITVPMTAALGVTRMRVISDYWGTNPSPCALGTFGTQRGEFEDYTFKVVVPPPAIGINIANSVQCAGTASPLITLTSPIGNYNTYSWSPSSGVTGDAVNGWTITSSTTMVYTLTGTQTSGDFSVNTVQFTFNANPLPTPITINPTPVNSTTCAGGTPVQLTASGGVISGVPVYSENFNTGAPGWTETHGTGPNWANAVWTIRPNNFIPTGPSWFGTVLSSNDNTAFYFSDNDAQGSGNANLNVLISPQIDLSGYTAASLSFWHYYRPWTPSQARVQISTNSTNGTNGTWNTLATYNTVQQGEPDDWVQVILDLNAYAGQANVRIRFHYAATWGWGWGVDNFVISGSATSAITWTPAAGLFTDPAGTVPYVEGTGAMTVYALPTETTVYTASASTISPICTTSTTAEVIITPVTGGTVTPAVQTACGGLSDLTSTGHSSAITRWEWSTSPTFATVNVIPASAAAVLTTAQIGSFSGTRYYRAVFASGTCTGYSYAPAAPDYASIAMETVTWNGSSWSNGTGPDSSMAAVFAGNYTGNANLEACSVVVNSGNVVFNSGYTLTVTNAVAVNGGTLTFNNNASLVQVNDSAVNTGYITYYRTTTPMIPYDYTYWSSPLSPQTFVGFSPLTQSDMYWAFSATGNTYVNVPGNSLMEPGKGYIVRAPEGHVAGNTFTAQFNGGSLDGTPNNGVITQNIYGPAPNNFNLLGNPYPSAIDADLFYSANMSVIDGSFYFWTHNTPIDPLQYTQSDYAIYNSTGGTGTGTAGGGTGNSSVPTGNIAAGQGFFVKGIGNGVATFNNSMRLVGQNNQFFRMPGTMTPQSLEKHRVWLDIRNTQGAYKQMLVGYIQNATNDKDMAFDADAVDSGVPVNLYSLIGTEKMAIQGRALPFSPSDEVPLGYKASAAGQLEISLYDFDGLFQGQNIYLEDKLLGIIHDLKQGSYAFVSEVGTFDDRFVLRYTDTALSTGDHALSPDAVLVYRNADGINVVASNVILRDIRIFDMRGRLLVTKLGINAREVLISDLSAPQQVLVVQVTTTDNKTVNKKIVY